MIIFKRREFYFLPLAVLFSPSAHAYIGPGVGLGAVWILVALLLGLVLLIIGLVWYPMKRMLTKKKADIRPEGSANNPE